MRTEKEIRWKIKGLIPLLNTSRDCGFTSLITEIESAIKQLKWVLEEE